MRLGVALRLAGALCAALAGCAGATVETRRPETARGTPPVSAPVSAPVSVSASASALELVESWPEATSLDHADLRDAKDVWPELFARARARIDLAQFYLSNQPGSALERCVAALEQAAARGVKVRVLAEEKFTTEYPDTLARLAAQKNFEVRHLDWKKVSGRSEERV